MREQLELILNLREEISNMITEKEKLKTEYDNLSNEFITISDSIKNMQKDLNDGNNEYNNTVFESSFRITKYFGWTVGIILFLFVLISEGFAEPLLLGFLGCASTMAGVMTSYLLSVILCSTNKFVLYMIKKYSNVKEIYYRVNQLEKDISLSEKNVEVIKKNLEKAKLNYKNKEEELNIKISELSKLEDSFFNRLIGANINNYDLNENIDCIVCKKRLLTPKDNI